MATTTFDTEPDLDVVEITHEDIFRLLVIEQAVKDFVTEADNLTKLGRYPIFSGLHPDYQNLKELITNG